MKFIYAGIGEAVEISDEYIRCLVIENGGLLGEIVSDIICCQKGENANSLFFETDTDIVNIENDVDIMVSPFSLNFNSKKIITSLQQELKNICLSGELSEKFHSLITAINEFGANLQHLSQFQLEFEPVYNASSILKMLNLHFQYEYENIEESILSYITVMRELCASKLIILVNISSFLSEKRLSALLSDIKYKKIPILMLENTEYFVKNTDLKINLVDKDLCRIK